MSDLDTEITTRVFLNNLERYIDRLKLKPADIKHTFVYSLDRVTGQLTPLSGVRLDTIVDEVHTHAAAGVQTGAETTLDYPYREFALYSWQTWAAAPTAIEFGVSFNLGIEGVSVFNTDGVTLGDRTDIDVVQIANNRRLRHVLAEHIVLDGQDAIRALQGSFDTITLLSTTVGAATSGSIRMILKGLR